MTNKTLKKVTILAVAASIGNFGVSQPAYGQGCCLTFPGNNSLSAFVTVYPNYFVPAGNPVNFGYTTPPAWFAVDVTGTNSPIPAAIYPAWSVDESYFLPATFSVIPGTFYTGTLISTCDSNALIKLPNHGGTPPVGPPPVVSLATWHEVNYILNHKTGYYWWNVQVALNRLVGGLAPNDPLLGTNADLSYPPVDTNQVAGILKDADNNAASWILPCGGTEGVLFVLPQPDIVPDFVTQVSSANKPLYQIIMLEVPCTCPSANCVTINATQGNPIVPVTLAGSGGAGAPYTFAAAGLPAGLNISATGTISGTPIVNGVFSYTVTVTDKNGNSGTLTCSVSVNPPPGANCVTINAVQGIAIQPVTLTGNGGCNGPYTFRATGLPAGLSISSNGTISGVASNTGLSTYTVTITDACGNKGSLTCLVTVNPPPIANCVAINAVKGTAIAPVTLLGSGGVGGPYTFTATGLPPGLTISSTGVISGTPTASGNFNYLATITDKGGNKGTLSCSVAVILTQPSANCVSINATAGVSIAPVALVGSGGVGGPYTFTATGLPPGLSISSTGVIAGTPTASGIFNYAVGITDKGGNTGTLNCSLAVQCNSAVIGGIDLSGLADSCLFFFANGSQDANWQGATKGFFGNVIVSSNANFRTSGNVPFAGTIYTDGSSLGQWQRIINQNTGQASASFGNAALVANLKNKLNAAFAQINSLPATPGFSSISASSLNGLNVSNGVPKTYVINITSGMQVSSKINITGDAGDVFILRWSSSTNYSAGYQGQVKFQSGGAIIPHGGLTPSSFINVAGDINCSGGGSNPPAPYPQGPRSNTGTGALIKGGSNFSGGGFFTGYWLTTGDPVTHQTSPFSNGIFVGGWYTTTTKFSMTSGTSGVYIAPTCSSGSDPD